MITDINVSRHLHPILVRCTPLHFLEPPREVLRILESHFVRNTAKAFACVKDALFCNIQYLLLNVLDGRHTCFLFYQIAEIIGGKTKFVSAILHCRDAFCYRQTRLIIIIKQRLETCKQVTVNVFAGNELAVIEAYTLVKQQFQIVDDERTTVLVNRIVQFLT